MPIMPLVELISGIAALLFAGAAFVNLSWSEGASSTTMKRESQRKTKRLFAVAGVLATITVVSYYLCLR